MAVGLKRPSLYGIVMGADQLTVKLNHGVGDVEVDLLTGKLDCGEGVVL